MQHDYKYHGLLTNAIEIQAFVEHIIQAKSGLNGIGKQEKSSICIWGKHGIGKTALVEQIAKQNNWKFVYIALAQFEEMGDLIGMPAIEHGKTVFRQPAWVPQEEGPGILLLDDVNRADHRILKGIMQLLQNHEMVSWKLPANWKIIMTANPDGGDYAVTPLDDAMLTRMMHISMKFEPKAWAIWAEKEGIDPRGINFVLTYPEIIQGKQTTPRSLVQFFRSIASIDDLKKELSLVKLLASSCLDEETVIAFITFIQQNMQDLISPETICNATNFKEEVEAIIAEQVHQDVFRVDIMATICTRLLNYLTIFPSPLNQSQITNIQSFILLDFIPNDLRLAFLQDIISNNKTSLKSVVNDPNVAKILLDNM